MNAFYVSFSFVFSFDFELVFMESLLFFLLLLLFFFNVFINVWYEKGEICNFVLMLVGFKGTWWASTQICRGESRRLLPSVESLAYWIFVILCDNGCEQFVCHVKISWTFTPDLNLPRSWFRAENMKKKKKFPTKLGSHLPTSSKLTAYFLLQFIIT